MLNLKSRKKPYNLTLKTNFKKYRNNLNNIFNNAKNHYYSNKVKQCNNDPKRVWRIINEATQGPKKKKNLIIFNYK